jgi:glutamate synthase domain-containing protein 3
MTGGQAYIYDLGDSFEERYNSELIAVRRLDAANDQELQQLIALHLEKTGSQRARAILNDWEAQRQLFWYVAPRENVVAIEAATEGSGTVETEEEKVTANSA